jgi:5'-nucleotidase
VIVNQVGWAGLKLGRLDFSFEGSSRRKLDNVQAITIGKKSGD